MFGMIINILHADTDASKSLALNHKTTQVIQNLMTLFQMAHNLPSLAFLGGGDGGDAGAGGGAGADAHMLDLINSEISGLISRNISSH